MILSRTYVGLKSECRCAGQVLALNFSFVRFRFYAPGVGLDHVKSRTSILLLRAGYPQRLIVDLESRLFEP